MAGYTGYAQGTEQQQGGAAPASPPGGFSAAQIAGSFNPGAFGGGQGALGAPQAPAYGPDIQNLQAILGGDINQYLPSLIGGANQLNSLNDQMQQLWAGNSLQGQQMQQNAGFQLQGLGLDTQGQAIQQGALQRQMALLPQQYGLQTQGFDLTQQQDQAGAAQALRNLNSAQTARGAFTSTGANQGRSDINQNLQFQLQRLGLERQGAGLNFAEQQAQQQDAQKQLAITAKRTGLSEQEVRTRLDNAIQQLGIQGQISADQILADQGKVFQGITSPLSSIHNDIMTLANIPITGNQ